MSLPACELVAKYGNRLLELHHDGDPIGRKTISRLLTKWSGENVTEWKARRVRQLLDIPSNAGPEQQHRMALERSVARETPNYIEDTQTSPTERSILAKGTRVKTLDDLLKAANVDETKWGVASWKANAWEQAQKDGYDVQIVTLHQVKASLQRKVEAAHRPARPTIKIRHSQVTPRNDGMQRAMFIPDSQIGFKWRDRYTRLEPMHDRLAFDACIKLAGVWKPDVVVLLGDMADLAPWSAKFPSDPTLKNTTQATIDELHWWLAQLRAAVGEHTKICYLAGNHEERISKRIVQDMPEAFGLTTAKGDVPVLTLANLLHLDDLNIEWVGPYGRDWWLWPQSNSPIRVTHGQTVRQGGGATAAAILKGGSWSEVYGHVHRLEYAEKTLHGPGGDVRVITAMSPGCLCRIDQGAVPGFKQRQDWQTGVGVGWLDERSGLVHVQAIPIREGRIVWSDGIVQAENRTEEIAKATGWTQFTGG